MRKTVYRCDHCKDDLGESTHISLSFGNYSGIAFKPEDAYWEVLESLNGRFVHFCNSKCVAAFFKTLMDKVKSVKGRGSRTF